MPAMIVRLVLASARFPKTTLLLAAMLVGVSVVCATQLTYKTQRNDLVSAEKDCQRRWQHYVNAFGEDDDFVFVLRGETRVAAQQLAERLRQRPDLFDRVFHEVDLSGVASRSVQYANVDELASIDERLDDLAPLLGAFSPVAWHSLSLEALLVKATQPTANRADERLKAELPKVLAAATKVLRNEPVDGSVWSGSAASMTNQRLVSSDGELQFVLARPRDTNDATAAIREARAIVETMRTPATEIGLTGLPVIEADEMAVSDTDSLRASWLALAGVAVLYFVVYRGVRYPLLTLSTLAVGTALALGWATVTVGHLNLLSATFAVMLIGLGDYGVLFVAHYDEQRRQGNTLFDALTHTARHAGPGIATAAITAALAFAATMLADFQAVAELGWIAGWGILFCGAACFTVLPALVALSERRSRSYARLLPFPGSERPFLPSLQARPKLVLLLGGAGLFVCLVGAGFVRYDANLLHMQARGTESVHWEDEIIRHDGGRTWDALSLAASREDALALKAKYEATPGFGALVEAASLVPADYDRKRPRIESIHRKLDGLPKVVPDFSLSTGSTVAELCAKLGGVECNALRTAIATLPEQAATQKLRTFDIRLRKDLHSDLSRLHAISHAGRIGVSDLPAAFRERYVSPSGTFLVRAYAAESLWDYAALERFTAAARTVDPEATGKAFRTLEGLKQMKAGFLRAGLAALVVITLVLTFDFRKTSQVLLALVPLAMGLIVTLGVMGIAGVALNPANLIALPLIVGVGVDNGVHVLHDYADRVGRWRLAAVTGRGIAVASLTTILGFGTLMIARHQGMASLGLALTLGVTACMLSSLIVLPALLTLRVAKPRAEVSTAKFHHPSRRIAA